MKAFAVGLSGAILLALAAGCRPQLAEVELGDTEMEWNHMIRESYPGFRPPRTAPPAIKDKNTPLQSVVPDGTDASADTESTDSADSVTTTTTETVNTPAGGQETVTDTNTVSVDEPATEAKPDAAKTAAAEPKAEGKFTEYVVKPGDSLSLVARKCYKDGRLYDRIYQANKSVIPNPNRLPIGLKLRIPQL